jgi:hypothetical protein
MPPKRRPEPQPKKPAAKAPKVTGTAQRFGEVGPGVPHKRPAPAVSPEEQAWLAYLNAEALQESGGDWHAVSPSDALGRWQVLASNLYGWARQCGMVPVSAQYYLDNPAYQTQLVTCILKPIFETHGAAQAAAWWYSGQFDTTATYGDPPVYVYVEEVLAKLGAGRLPGGLGGAVGPDTFGLGPTPGPGNDSWSHYVDQTAAMFAGNARTINGHTNRIRSAIGTREDY